MTVATSYLEKEVEPVGYKRIGANIGANQKVYVSSDDNPGYVLKIAIDNGAFDLTTEKRAENQVNAHEKCPDLFPDAKKAGKGKVHQRYVSGGVTLREAMKKGKYDTTIRIFKNLKSLHDRGYKHGDVNSTNLGEFGSEGYLSVDTETFGNGEWREDLRRAIDTGERHNPGFIPKVIEKVYGSRVLEELKN